MELASKITLLKGSFYLLVKEQEVFVRVSYFTCSKYDL